MRLHALSVGIEAPNTCFTGVVHSVFPHACNIRIDRDGLLTLVTQDKPNLPQGIRLATPSGFSFRQHVQMGQPVACRAGILRVGGSELTVDLRTARRWHLDLGRLGLDLHRPDHAQAWTVAWLEWEALRPPGGISVLTDVHASASAFVTRLHLKASTTVPAILDATRASDVGVAAASLRSLIGLGPGLTPSGDDFVVGYLAGLRSAAGHELLRWKFLTAIGDSLSDAASRAGTISRAYLLAGARGHFSEPISMLARQLSEATDMDSLRAATRGALQIGHTSGADGVLGFLLGAAAWTAPWPLHDGTGASWNHVAVPGDRSLELTLLYS
jgi:hypothetical protein